MKFVLMMFAVSVAIVTTHPLSATIVDTYPQMNVFEAFEGTFEKTIETKQGGEIREVTTGKFFEHTYQFHFYRSYFTLDSSAIEIHEFWVFSYDPENARYVAHKFSQTHRDTEPEKYTGTWDSNNRVLNLERADDTAKTKKIEIHPPNIDGSQ